MQGDAIENYQGTCALTSIANLITQTDIANLLRGGRGVINHPNFLLSGQLAREDLHL